MSAAIDLAAAIKTQWAADATLVALVPTTRLYQGKLPGSPTAPYVAVKIEQEREPQYFAPVSATSTYIAFLMVTFEAYALSVGASLKAVVDAMLAAFDDEFALPSGRLMSWLLVGEPTVTEAGMKDGETVYLATMKYRAMVQRSRP